ncbi:MAG: cbb3-type cytochrome oxidase assembly protein CcoS [Gammaproteobacteria bacterium]|jgi:cbb3-type cytochrome oxidase maturation protein|nr:cbb3-type cytochrome oxidase assembly protein CcoS [Gammaproteobacteria bacterium]MBU2278120.1 cbb3-type cytochrome oxidase assembly protein CcoS [Gammaproteobacteria bacterium]MBU2425390.1 cbb3-type cytochrome oxidase assembly protein CcoS [Gammaproteobacteria bacterium]
MSIIYVLIPIAVLFVMIGLGVFFWAVRSRQFDDLDKEAYSILFDNEPSSTKQKKNEPTADEITTKSASSVPDAAPPSLKDQ